MELDYDPKKHFGAHLAALRHKKGISQERLSLESGVARSYLSGVERGVRNIALLNICILAKALALPPAALLNFPTEGESRLTKDGAPAGDIARAEHTFIAVRATRSAFE